MSEGEQNQRDFCQKIHPNHEAKTEPGREDATIGTHGCGTMTFSFKILEILTMKKCNFGY